MLFTAPAAAADNFIQLYITANGGCGGPTSPLSFVLVGQDINSPFGKAAADWNDDDLAALKPVLAACEVTSARRGNPYNLAEIKRDTDKLLADIPAIVGQARDRMQAQIKQVEARRQIASARIDKATQARQQAKASAETEAAQLEREAAAAEAEARDAQRRADARIERATRARDEAKAKAAAIASLEQGAQQEGGIAPRVRRAAPGELSELMQEGDTAGVQQPGKPLGPLAMSTVIEAQACPTIDEVASASAQVTSVPDKAGATSTAPGACVTIAKGTRATIQAAGASPTLKALCVAGKGIPDVCGWRRGHSQPQTSDNSSEQRRGCHEL